MGVDTKSSGLTYCCGTDVFLAHVSMFISILVLEVRPENWVRVAQQLASMIVLSESLVMCSTALPKP